MLHPLIFLVLSAVLAADGAGTQPAPEPAPPCKVAADSNYGFSREQPIQVGGSPVPNEQSWPLAVTAADLVDAPMPARPASDASGAPFVTVQAIIDHQGAFREARALGGPDVLVRAALAAVNGWRARPATANGAPLTTPVVLMVRFTGPVPDPRH